MAKKKRKETATQKAYKRERKRILNYMSKQRQKGFIWTESPLPAIPKKVTKASVERLRKLTPEALTRKAEYVVPDTGELVTAQKGQEIRKQQQKQAREQRKKEKQQQKERRERDTWEDWYEDAGYEPEPTPFVGLDTFIVDAFYEKINLYPNGTTSEVLTQWMNTLVRDNGMQNVAQMLSQGFEEGLTLDYQVFYDAGASAMFMTRMMHYLPDQGSIYRDQVMDLLELGESWELPE